MAGILKPGEARRESTKYTVTAVDLYGAKSLDACSCVVLTQSR